MRNSPCKKCISITIAFIVSAGLRFGRDSEGNCVVRADNDLVIGAAYGIIITPPRCDIIFFFCAIHFHETDVILHHAVETTVEPFAVTCETIPTSRTQNSSDKVPSTKHFTSFPNLFRLGNARIWIIMYFLFDIITK